MNKVTFNLHAPLSNLEQLKNRRYSYAEVADISSLTRQGVRRLLKEPSETVSVVTLAKLLDFFSAEGMPITVDQLFTVQGEGSQAENLDSQPL